MRIKERIIVSLSLIFLTGSFSAAAQQPTVTVRDAKGNDISAQINMHVGGKKQSTDDDTAESTDAPQMVIEQPVFEAGEVWQGEIVSHDFIIKNKGKGPLKILKAKPG